MVPALIRGAFIVSCLAPFAAICLTACAPIRIHRSSIASPEPPSQEETRRFILFGGKELGGPIALNERCPEGWASFSSEVTTGQVLLRVVTLGFYQPWKVAITCSKRSE